MTTKIVHPIERANRTNKVRRFVNFLDAQAPAFTSAATLEQLTVAQWLRIAELATENMPSEATIAGIVAYFRAREDASARVGVV